MKIAAHLDYKVILANTARPVFFALQFEAPTGNAVRPKPAAFCLVLDRSSSMSGIPLQSAKKAALLAIRNLRTEDEFSLVVFDSEAQVLVPLQQASNKELFNRAVNVIFPRQQTNLTGGWMLGRDELKKAKPDASWRLLLLSDGQLNQGITDPAAVRQVVSAGLLQQGIRTSCLGFGLQYNEDLMAGMAQVAGGQFYDAVAPEKLPAIFASELDGLQKLTIQNLRVRLRRLDFCEAFRPLGNYPAVQRPDGGVEFFLGDLVSQEGRVACFQLDVLPLPWVEGRPVVSLEGEQLLKLEIVYDEIGETEITSRTYEQIVRIQATQNPAEVKQKAEIIPWVAMQRAGQVMNDVTKLMDAGDLRGAITTLQNAIAGLKAYGPDAPVSEAIQQLESLLRRIAEGGWSAGLRKSSRYRSHTYGRMSTSELWSGQEPPPSFKKPPEPPKTPPLGS